MNASDTLDKLIPALVAAQEEFAPVLKQTDGQVGNKVYKYADLAAVLEAVKPALNKHGFALVQPMTFDGTIMLLHTRLLHTSGQWIGGAAPVPTFAKAQDLGSYLTYFRRYGAISLLGIAAEDDDGAAASQDKPKAKDAKPAPKPAIPGTPVINEAQRKALRDTAQAIYGAGYIAKVKALMLEVAGVEDTQHLSEEGFNKVIQALGRVADMEAERASIS